MSETMKLVERLRELAALEPCPFCGGEAEIWRAIPGRPTRKAWIACMAGCAVLTKEHDTDAEAIAAWNRRSHPATGRPTREDSNG